jgi:rhamnogalacturonyl hydrolase YesR
MEIIMKKLLPALGASALLSLSFTSCELLKSQSHAIVQSKTVQQSAQDIGSRAARWQIDKLEKNDFQYLAPRYFNSSSNPLGWIQAAFYIGLTEWTETTDDKLALAHIQTMAKQNDYQLLLKRPLHADDHAIGQTFLWLTEQTGNQQAYQPTQNLFDSILANPPKVSLEMIEETPKRWGFEGACQDRWCWADALFMAPRTWLKLTNITGESKYFDYADQEFWATADYLFSDQYGLFFRDSRYFEQKSDNGKPVFWSRGNGWVFASLPLLLDDLAQDHPSRTRYIELYKKNAAGLVKIQNANGYWPASLLDPNKVKTPETSGTGFITYGLAWGVNNGMLTEQKYIDAVNKGWKALENAVQPNGRLNWVQQVGKSPDPVSKSDTQLYGVGALLLAASEMTKWQH